MSSKQDRPLRRLKAGAPYFGASAAVTLDARTEIDSSQWGLRWAKMGAGLHNRVSIKATFVRR